MGREVVSVVGVLVCIAVGATWMRPKSVAPTPEESPVCHTVSASPSPHASPSSQPPEYTGLAYFLCGTGKGVRALRMCFLRVGNEFPVEKWEHYPGALGEEIVDFADIGSRTATAGIRDGKIIWISSDFLEVSGVDFPSATGRGTKDVESALGRLKLSHPGKLTRYPPDHKTDERRWVYVFDEGGVLLVSCSGSTDSHCGVYFTLVDSPQMVDLKQGRLRRHKDEVIRRESKVCK
jgi:hypothetical protein